MAAYPREGAYSWGDSVPSGQCGIEELHEYPPNILAHPLVEDAAEEFAPLLRGDGFGCNGAMLMNFCKTAVGTTALNDGCKLDIPASDGLEEAVKLLGDVNVGLRYDCHRVPFDAVMLQEAYAAHDAVECGLARGGCAVSVVNGLWAVNGYADEPSVAAEHPAQGFGDERAIGLQAVDDTASAGIPLLQLHGFLEEGGREHGRLAAMPCEDDFVSGLRPDILAYKFFKCGIGHACAPRSGGIFLKVVTVGAPQIAHGSDGLSHKIHYGLKGVVR